MNQLPRLCEGHHCDNDAATIEFGLGGTHLAEMRLAWQSGQVPKKDQQKIIIEVCREVDALAGQVEQRQLSDGDVIHHDGK